MQTMNRRTFGITAAMGALALSMPMKVLAAAQKRYRLLLHTSYAGPVAFMLLAQDRGYLAKEGLEIDLAEGGGAAAIVPEVKSPAYDGGYGDMTALIEVIANSAPNRGPIAVYTTFNTVPFTIAVPVDSPIRTPKDLEGKTLTGHPKDAALLTFDMFAKATGIDASTVTSIQSPVAMGDQVVDAINGKVDGVFGFVNTIVASVGGKGIDGHKELRFLEYADYLPEMYGNTLFVTREFYEKDPDGVRGMVRAFNHALADTAQNPDTAIDALMKRRPDTLRAVNLHRLEGTMKVDMGNAEGARIGIGDMDDARLAKMIALVVASKNLPRTPSVREVFDHGFLPPEGEKIRTMPSFKTSI
ncbi:MAG: ABC transporter substrate-binding protein [Sphingobium sp.]